MIEGEARFGAPFGSGRLVTPEVWAIIEKLHPPNGSEIGPEEKEAIRRELAMAEAWFNGCSRPEHNIATNQGGALANAHGDGRNNFLYGLIADIAGRTNRDLYHDWVNGEEREAQGVCEAQNVPTSFVQGVRRGFAREAPYRVTSKFWTRVDEARDTTSCFCDQLELLEQAVKTSNTAQELSDNFM